MITFASERGLGQDLATHLLNEHDNEKMELADVRGAVAKDLHGAMAEWEFQAHSLTKAQNYLFSMSVNPWDRINGPMSRDQYFEFIDHAEKRLGLSGQPRAVVFHTKEGREHCHVVWSRTDAEEGRAVPLPFFKNTLMMVTREFARDHDLELPRGYEKGRDGKNKQLSLYEMHQQRAGGLSKEEHMEQVTDAWRQSDSPKAFVQALADRGYMLANGKRPYVLVDLYGHMNALPKLIDDKTVRTKDIRAFLEADFPPESLPSVEQARAIAAEHRKAMEGFREHEQKAEALAELKTRQATRRENLEKQNAALKDRQQEQRQYLANKHRSERDAHNAAHVAETRRIRIARHEREPKGLAAFLGRVSGVAFIRKSFHQYQDRKRRDAFLNDRNVRAEKQARQRRGLERRHLMQKLDMDRKVRSLDQIDHREQKSLEQSLAGEMRSQARGGRDHMPLFSLEPKPKTRQRTRLSAEMEKATSPKRIDLQKEFFRAASDQQGEGKSGTSEGSHPKERPKINRRRRRKRDHDKDRGR